MGLKGKMMNGMMDKMSAEKRKEMMDSIMENFFSKMSKDEKQAMMNDMMGNFFSNMTQEEKQSMMQNMMPGMMGSMMGGGKNNPMPGMMSMMGNMMNKMMGGNKNEEGSAEMPWEMCKKMMSSMSKTADLATFATPEIKQLFEDWIQQIDEELLAFVKKSDSIDIEKIQENFKLSKDSVVYFLTRLAQKGKIKFKKDEK